MREPKTRLLLTLPLSLARALELAAAEDALRPAQFARVLLARHMAAAARKPAKRQEVTTHD